MWLSLMLQQFHGATITHFRTNVGDMQPKRLAVGLRERLVKHQFGGDKFQHLSGFLQVAARNVGGFPFHVLRIACAAHGFVQVRTSKTRIDLQRFLHVGTQGFEDVCA